MAPSSQPRKTRCRLSNSVQRRLNMYVLAAGAAGIGTLILPHPAEARIVYTPAHDFVDGKLHIDLNHDGISDFMIYSTANCGASICVAVLQADENELGNGIAYQNDHGLQELSALKLGSGVGSNQKFASWGTMMGYQNSQGGTGHWGHWFDVKERYLGLKFQIKGKTHYGWARFNVQDQGIAIQALLTGYAYETIPNKPIVTGDTKGPDEPVVEPAGLGHLALGMR
jgi:hypothetical protein